MTITRRDGKPMPVNRRIRGLRTVRKRLGLTLMECADILFVTSRTIGDYESGKYAPADPERIASILGVPVEELYEE